MILLQPVCSTAYVSNVYPYKEGVKTRSLPNEVLNVFRVILLAHSVSKLILRIIEPISAEVTAVTAKVTGENAPAPTTQLISKWRISLTMKKKGWHCSSCPQNSSTLEPNGSYQKEAWGGRRSID